MKVLPLNSLIIRENTGNFVDRLGAQHLLESTMGTLELLDEKASRNCQDGYAKGAGIGYSFFGPQTTRTSQG
jgi:hypothetical protein